MSTSRSLVPVASIRTEHRPFPLDPEVVEEYARAHREGKSYEAISPWALFADHTFIGRDDQGKQWKSWFVLHCLQQQHVPLIEHHNTLGWIWHTLFTPDGHVHRKRAADLINKPFSVTSWERKTAREKALFLAYKIYIARPRHSAQYRPGSLTSITTEALFKAPHDLTEITVLRALGDLIAARATLIPRRRAILIIRDQSAHNAVKFFANFIGVEVQLWQPK